MFEAGVMFVRTLQLVTSSGVTEKSSISERRISCISEMHRPPTCWCKL